MFVDDRLPRLPMRTRYSHQVRRIAPQLLEGREAELAELAEFCASESSGEGYVWWRGGAWTGKSALLSWFVLHPPEGVVVVSFFITARLESQSDRAAFIENMLEQLLTLLGEQQPPSLLTAATRDAYLLDRLADAADACVVRGRRLVLVVDGLDEDRSLNEGPDSHSIAGLLPAVLPAGMRVVVAGRPNPPIPADVPHDHPLRNPAIVRPLTQSSRARALRSEMERDLWRLLRGSVTEQDLLGLITAAGGGLSVADLAELTDWSPWEIGLHLRSVAGRSFASRDSHYRPGEQPEVLLLGHEELQVTAIDILGPARLTRYRDRLHTWAQEYRARQWPPETPEYLLRGYFRVLQATGDLERMVQCATDPHRQDRMLDLSGGDAAALAEITTALDTFAARSEPDLTVILRLAIHRDHLVQRNNSIPIGLPVAWASLGRITRAEQLASSIPDPHKQAQALIGIAAVAADTLEADRVADLLAQAERVARLITRDYRRVEVLEEVKKVAVAAGVLGQDEQVPDAQTDDGNPERALIAATEMVVVSDTAVVAQIYLAVFLGIVAAHMEAVVVLSKGDPDRAKQLYHLFADDENLARASLESVKLTPVNGGHNQAEPTHGSPQEVTMKWAKATAARGDFDRAEQIARSLTRDYQREEALAEVAKSAAASGELDRAEQLTRSLTHEHHQVEVLMEVVRTAAATEKHDRTSLTLDRVEKVTASLTHDYRREEVLVGVAKVAAAAGDIDRAERIIRSSTNDEKRARMLMEVAMAVAGKGDNSRAASLLDRAEQLTRTLTHDHQQARALTEVAKAAAADGDLARAEQLARSLVRELQRMEVLAAMAKAAAAGGDFDRAEQLARSLTDDHQREEVLAEAAKAAAAKGVIDRAERIIRSFTDDEKRAQVLVKVAKAAAAGGDLDRAEQLARSLPHDFQRAEVLAEVAKAAAANGDLDRTDRLTSSLAHDNERAWMVVEVAKAVAASGDLARAEQLAGSLTRDHQREEVLVTVAKAAAASGDHARTDRLTTSLSRDYQRMEVLVETAKAAAASGDLARAEQLAGSLTRDHQREEVLTEVVKAVTAGGDLDRAEQMARSFTDDERRAEVLTEVVRAAAANGDLDRAERVARSFTDDERRAQVLTEVVRAAAANGDLDRAEKITHTSPDNAVRSRMLMVAADLCPQPHRARLAAIALMIAPWHAAVDRTVISVPDAASTIATELQVVRRSATL